MSEWYAEYLASGRWQETRLSKLEEQNYTCEKCGYRAKPEFGDPTIGLHVHHLTYERVRREEPGDLQVLCGWCHGNEHGLGATSQEQWQARITDWHLSLRTVYIDEIADEVAAWDELAERVDA